MADRRHYFVQIRESDTAWIPGIHRMQTKRECVDFASKLDASGVPVRLGYYAGRARVFLERSCW